MIQIATWNLQRPKIKGWARNPRIVGKLIEESDVDLWIFTETSAVISPGDEFFSASTLPIPDYHTLGECCTAIWTKWRMLSRIETFDPGMAICIEVESPVGPMIVYGTIITYANDPGPKLKSKRWEEHRKSILKHAEDWKRIKDIYPEHLIVVGGDFNQGLDGTYIYDRKSYEMLTEALQNNNLVCLTNVHFPDLSRIPVGHICASPALKERLVNVEVWEGKCDAGPLSDHNGIKVVISTD